MVKQKNAAVAEVAARRHWREQDARLLLEAWRGSGQTLTAFAQHYGVHPERLGRWHRFTARAAGEPGPVPSGAGADGGAAVR
jgi:hypothetical protein